MRACNSVALVECLRWSANCRRLKLDRWSFSFIAVSRWRI